MEVQTHPNGIVPSLSQYRVGGKGGRVAKAVQMVWDELGRTDYKQAAPLAEKAARAHDIKPESVIDHLSRMARDGLLDVELRPVATTVVRRGQMIEAHRQRKFIRIAS